MCLCVEVNFCRLFQTNKCSPLRIDDFFPFKDQNCLKQINYWCNETDVTCKNQSYNRWNYATDIVPNDLVKCKLIIF